MRNTVLVIKHELATTLGKRSFWLTTFLFPLMIIAFATLPQIMAQDIVNGSSLDAVIGGATSTIRSAFVDESGIVKALPSDVPADAILSFASESAANDAMQAGTITQYYVIPADYIATGDMVLVTNEFSPMTAGGDTGLLEYVIAYNFIGNDTTARLAINPLQSIQSHALEAAAPPSEGYNAYSFGVPYAAMFLLFFTITMSSGYMLQSVAKEKENRTAEVLLLSLRPVELMLGKVLGLGMIVILQMTIWLGAGLLAVSRGGTGLAALASVHISPVFGLWALAFCLLGYLVYASALGAVGALAPTVREGSQFTFVVLLPLMLPVWLNFAFTQDPNGTLATVLSLIPLTAPASMVARLAAADVPLWQPVVSIIGLALTAYFFVWMSSRFFRADTLLSDVSLTWKRIGKELRG